MSSKESEDVIDLMKLCKVLLSKLWLISIVTVLFAVVSFGVTKYMIKPEYQATSKLYVFNKSDVNDTGAVSSSDISTSKKYIYCGAPVQFCLGPGG